jgi:hypothetical protein
VRLLKYLQSNEVADKNIPEPFAGGASPLRITAGRTIVAEGEETKGIYKDELDIRNLLKEEKRTYQAKIVVVLGYIEGEREPYICSNGRCERGPGLQINREGFGRRRRWWWCVLFFVPDAECMTEKSRGLDETGGHGNDGDTQ